MKKSLLKSTIVLAMFCQGLIAAAPDIVTHQAADSVLGQASFNTTLNGTAANRMLGPRGVAVDPTTGKVFVADRSNHRVLRFTSAAALASGASAELVFGQISFGVDNFNGPSQTSIGSPESIAFDPQGRMYVADSLLNRVLRFDTPSSGMSNNPAANIVLGQTGFATGQSGLAGNKFNKPVAVAVDNDYLWVSDSNNNRVLGFPNPATLMSGATATKVLGQAAANANLTENPPQSTTMIAPEGLAISSTGTLWVADTGNNRLLRFTNAKAASQFSAVADKVLGQPGFDQGFAPVTTTAANLDSPQGLAIDENASSSGSLWVTDQLQNRVLRFDHVLDVALQNGADASVVLGQSTFSGSDYFTSQRGVDHPYGVAIDTFSAGTGPRTLWVADSNNNRVLRFTPKDPTVQQVPAAPAVSARAKIKTKKKKLNISGTASSGVAIARVVWNGRLAAGTTHWTFRAKCKVGKNRFTVVAIDTLGRSSVPRRIIVIRKR